MYHIYIKQVEALVGLPQPSVEALPCRFQAPLNQVRPMNPMFCFVFSTFLFLNVYTPILFSTRAHNIFDISTFIHQESENESEDDQFGILKTEKKT